MLQVVNSLKDSLSPDVMPFVKVSTVEMEGKQVVEIDVTTGTNRPYYLREKRAETQRRVCPQGKLHAAHD